MTTPCWRRILNGFLVVCATVFGSPSYGTDLAIPLQPGWNLLGNTATDPIVPATDLVSIPGLVSVWKWNSQTNGWELYAPPPYLVDLATTAAANNATVLSSIGPGEGYWVNTSQASTFNRSSVNPYSLGTAGGTRGIIPGWNLVATGDALSPAQVDTKLGGAPSFVTMWAWNAASQKWYFYTPTLTAGELVTYNAAQVPPYLDFGTLTTDNGLGFWINSNVTVPVGTNSVLTIQPTSDGTVSSSTPGTPSVTDCTSTGGTCAGTYPSGTLVTLTATADPPSGFLGWGSSRGTCAGTFNPCTLTVNGDVTLPASFGLGPPGAPTGATATAGNAQATVSFAAPIFTGSSAITGYTVTSNPAGGIDSNAGFTGLSHVITGLANGIPYTFTVVATNSSGPSVPSAPSNSVTPATVPGAPTGVTAVAGNAQATVSFIAPSNGGAAITGYTVISNPAGGVDPGGTSLSRVITGLTNGQAYTFTASNSATPATVPDAPTIGTATGGHQRASVTFTPPAFNGGAPITGYTVTSSPLGGVDSNAGTTGLSHLITGLTNGQLYTFTVTATNSVGTGAASTASNSVTPAPTAPDAPTIGTATARNKLATVSFTAPANNGGFAITAYTVTSNPAGGVDPGGTSLSRVITGLTNGIAYTFTVTATNSIGTGAASAASNSATPAVPPPYFLSPAGNDSASGLLGSPWLTFSKAWAVLLPGDTLQVDDGSYASPSPPAGKSGIAGNEITVQATNPGGAKITSALNFKGNAYLSFIGLKITGTTKAVDVVSNGVGAPSHHLTFQQIGFNCTSVTLNNNACFTLTDGTHHVLLEDSWGWGGGRYTVMCYGGDGGSPPNVTCVNNTFRRLVLRMGPSTSTSGNPQASLALYYAANNIVENVVAIDGQAASDSSNAAFYITGHAPLLPPWPNADANSNKFYGVIALNNLGVGFWLDCPGAVCNSNEVYNSVFWDSSRHAAANSNGTCNSTIFDHNTMASAGSTEHGLLNYACLGASITNNALYSNSGYGASQGGGGTTTTNNNNGYFGNTSGARNSLAAGAGDLTLSDPGFSYITRIEAASPYHLAGSSGDIGANVINRYQDGTLTGTALWPWPNEDRVRTEMCEVVVGNWCTSGKTLTKYIWEYLGNTSPY